MLEVMYAVCLQLFVWISCSVVEVKKSCFFLLLLVHLVC